MKSTNSFLFLALQAQIAAITLDNVKVFRFIDHDLGFLDEDIPALSYPAVLIDMNDTRYADMAENSQMGVKTVMLKVVFAPYSATNNLTPDAWKEKGLNYYEIEELLHEAIQGWQPAYVTEDVDRLELFGAFDRTSARTDLRRKDLRVRLITYTIGFEDYGTRSTEITYIPTPPADVETEIDVELEDL